MSWFDNPNIRPSNPQAELLKEEAHVPPKEKEIISIIKRFLDSHSYAGSQSQIDRFMGDLNKSRQDRGLSAISPEEVRKRYPDIPAAS